MAANAIAEKPHPKGHISHSRRAEEVDPVSDTHDRFAKDEATEWIRELILSGELRGGELISENLLAERFGKERSGSISRTPIRQALTRLSAEGLVEILPRFGTRVRLVHADDAINIMGLRYAIETVIVCKLAHDYAKSKVDLSPLVDLQAMMQGYTTENRPLTTEEKTKFVRADIEFHVKLAELAGCSPAIDPLRMFSGQFLLVGVPSIQKQSIRQNVVDEHQAVIEAIRSGDESQARGAMHRHLYSTLDRWSPYSSEYLKSIVPGYFGLPPLEQDDIGADQQRRTAKASRRPGQRR